MANEAPEELELLEDELLEELLLEELLLEELLLEELVLEELLLEELLLDELRPDDELLFDEELVDPIGSGLAPPKGSALQPVNIRLRLTSDHNRRACGRIGQSLI